MENHKDDFSDLIADHIGRVDDRDAEASTASEAAWDKIEVPKKAGVPPLIGHPDFTESVKVLQRPADTSTPTSTAA